MAEPEGCTNVIYTEGLPEPPGYFKVRGSVHEPEVKSGEMQG